MCKKLEENFKLNKDLAESDSNNELKKFDNFFLFFC